MTDRPHYDAALTALQGSFDACYEHPKRDVIGMSHGPFSGVNVALGIVDSLERENKALRARIRQLDAEAKNER